MQEMNARKE